LKRPKKVKAATDTKSVASESTAATRKAKPKTAAKAIIVPHKLYEPVQEIPRYLPNTLIEIKFDSPLYSSVKCTSIIETVLAGSVLHIVEQDALQPEIILTHFANLTGYLRIVDIGGELRVGGAENQTLLMSFRDCSAPGLLQKWTLTPGTVCETAYCLPIHDGEDASISAWIDTLALRERLVVLKLGRHQRAFVRSMSNKYVYGWISLWNEFGEPLIGYQFDQNANSEYECGASLEVKMRARFLDNDDELKPGTRVTVDAIGTGVDYGKLFVSTPLLSGWIYTENEDEEAILGHVGGDSIQMGDVGRNWFEAAKVNNTQMMEYVGKKKHLFSRRVDVPHINVVDSRHRTALMHACGWGNLGVCSLLCAEGADVTIKGDCLRSALHYACRRFEGANDRSQDDFKRICELLLSKKAYLEDVDTNGATPVMYASARGDYEVVKYLVESCGANVHHTTYNGVTCMQMATLQNHRAVADLLLKNGASSEEYGPWDESDDDEESEPELDTVSVLSDPVKTPRKRKVKRKLKKRRVKNPKADEQLKLMSQGS